jgi:mRNA interferase MazF
MTVLCPITSTISTFPMHVTLPEGDGVHGQVCVEQIRACDLEARPHTVIGRAGQETMGPVLDIIGGIFDI